MNFNIYYFINEFDKNEIEKLSTQISLIYRNYNKKNKPNELRELVKHCKNNGRKVYISNNLKDAIMHLKASDIEIISLTEKENGGS